MTLSVHMNVRELIDALETCPDDTRVLDAVCLVREGETVRLCSEENRPGIFAIEEHERGLWPGNLDLDVNAVPILWMDDVVWKKFGKNNAQSNIKLGGGMKCEKCKAPVREDRYTRGDGVVMDRKLICTKCGYRQPEV